MKEKITILCIFCLFLFPVTGFTEPDDESPAAIEVDGYQPISAADAPSPRTNPKWQRNPQARKAYRSGDPGYAGYPPQQEQNTDNAKAYYKRGSAQSPSPNQKGHGF